MTRHKRQFDFKIQGMDPDYVVALNVQYYLDKISTNPDFQKEYPNMTSREYLSKATHINPRRLGRILSTGSNNSQMTPYELYKISKVLEIPIMNFFSTDNIKSVTKVD